MASGTLAAPLGTLAAALGTLAAASGFAVKERGFFSYLTRQRGWRFAVAGVATHLLYYLTCLAGLGVGTVLWVTRRRR